MGSANSCVDSNTKKVFLEVYFDPDLISNTGRRQYNN